MPQQQKATPVRRVVSSDLSAPFSLDRGPTEKRREYSINWFGAPSRIEVTDEEPDLSTREKMAIIHLGIDYVGDHIDAKLASQGAEAYAQVGSEGAEIGTNQGGAHIQGTTSDQRP